MMSKYRVRPSTEIREALDALPVGQEWDVLVAEKISDEELANAETQRFPQMITENEHKFKAIVVEIDGKKQVVDVPTNQYKLVQHKTAFEPIIEGLTQAGAHEYNFVMFANAKKASLHVFTETPAHDGVHFGFRCVNSFNRTTSINFGFKVEQVKTLAEGYTQRIVELVGLRQVCSNGMVLKVPLLTSEHIEEARARGPVEWRKREFWVPPEVERKLMMAEQTKIQHTKSAEGKLKALQYVVEAVALLRAPMDAFIQKAQQWTVEDIEKAREIIIKHVGKRHAKAIISQYQKEPSNSLWDLYNAVTWTASHNKMGDYSREGLLNRAADLLLAEMQEGGDAE